MTDTEAAKCINYLRMEGFSMEDQIRISKRTKGWITQIHTILKLETPVVKAYLADRITHPVALKMASMTPNDRLKALAEAEAEKGS